METTLLQPPSVATRLYFLDWVRVLAFLLLIFYHTGMGYVGPVEDWGWHVKNGELSEGLGLFMLLMNGWRLPLLFLISGAGVYYALGRRTPAQFAGERLRRLGIPVIAGMFGVVVPLQVYIDRINAGQFAGSFWQFWPSIFTTGTYPTGNLSWHHLWFVVYILVYSLLLLPFFLKVRKDEQLRQRLTAWLSNPWVLISPAIILILMQPLQDLFPTTHNLTWDWANHLRSLFMFVLGYLFAATNLWARIASMSRAMLIAAAVFYLAYYTQRIFFYVAEPGLLRDLRLLCYRLTPWFTILAILGYAYKYLTHTSPFLRYANEAVFPFYILHQTLTLALVYCLLPWQAHWFTKYFFVALGIFSGCWLIYELCIRRWLWVRPLFGMKVS